MLREIKKAIKILGITKVAYMMGYRSPCTISHWIKNKRVPRLAQERVREFLRENKDVLHN